jgi:hypothetical protein
MNTGLSAAQMQDFIAVLTAKVGQREVKDASAVLSEVLSDRAKSGYVVDARDGNYPPMKTN